METENTIIVDSLGDRRVLFQFAQKDLKSGDLYFDCPDCGKVPEKHAAGRREIGPSPKGRTWWEFDCPGCSEHRVSPLWIVR